MKAHLLDILSVSLNSTRVEGSYLTWSLADIQSGYEGLWLYFCAWVVNGSAWQTVEYTMEYSRHCAHKY